MAQYTEFLGITKLEPGQQQAHVVANEAFDNYDRAVAGLAEVDLSGRSACDLTAWESTHAVLRLVKADRDCLVTVQARPKTWTVINDCGRAVRFQAEGDPAGPMTLAAGSVSKLLCDGSALRAATGGGGGAEAVAAHNQSPAAHNALTAARTYYIRSGGSDQNDGLSPAAALATVAGAKAKLRRLKTNGYAVTLDLGEGTWPAISFLEGEVGDAAVVILNGAGSSLTTVSSAGSYAVRISNLAACFTVRNIGITCSGGTGLDANDLLRLDVSNLRFGPCGGTMLNLQLTHGLVGAGLVIDGGAAIAFGCANGSYLRVHQAITLVGTPHFSSTFTLASGCSFSFWSGATFIGEATGIRYRSEYLSCIRTSGGGANFFPGDAAGVLNSTTGGYYA